MGYAITYDARGRGAYIVKQKEEVINGEKTRGFRLCAEPPPDAVANTSASREINAGVEAAVALKAIEIATKGSGRSVESAKSEIAEVATRTELVLLMRDALYRICEMNANGVLDDPKAEKVFLDVLATARTLGQRDNVGKLVDVLSIVARSPSGENTSQLIESIVSTIRLVALGDQVMQASGGADGIVTVLVISSLLHELDKVSDPATRTILANTIKFLVEQLEKEKKRLGSRNEGERTKIQAEIDQLIQLGKHLGVPEEDLPTRD